jgi:hypothetical protein
MKKLVLLLLISFKAIAGDVVGNGGDYWNEYQKAAWFVGSEPIKYCLEISPDFGVSEGFIQNDLKEVFKTWRNYISKKGIFFTDSRGKPIKLVTEFKKENCNENTELTFYFGTTNSEIEKEKKKYFNPVGFAVKKEYDLVSQRSKGYIWLANPAFSDPKLKKLSWEKGFTLRGMLLHEVGHIFGNEHIDDTIMSSEIVAKILESSDNMDLTLIDWGYELAFCYVCNLKYDGGISFLPKNLNGVYKTLTNEIAPSEVSAKLNLEHDHRPAPFRMGHYEGTLELISKNKTHILYIKTQDLDQAGYRSGVGGASFKFPTTKIGNDVFNFSMPNNSLTLMGKLDSISGTHTIMLEFGVEQIHMLDRGYALDQSLLKIYLIHDGEKKRIFGQQIWNF